MSTSSTVIGGFFLLAACSTITWPTTIGAQIDQVQDELVRMLRLDSVGLERSPR